MHPVREHPELIIYLALFVQCFLLVIFLTPFTVTLARKIGAIDYPEARKIHRFPVPRLGAWPSLWQSFSPWPSEA